MRRAMLHAINQADYMIPVTVELAKTDWGSVLMQVMLNPVERSTSASTFVTRPLGSMA